MWSVLLVLNNLDSAGLVVNVYGVNGWCRVQPTIWSSELLLRWCRGGTVMTLEVAVPSAPVVRVRISWVLQLYLP